MAQTLTVKQVILLCLASLFGPHNHKVWPLRKLASMPDAPSWGLCEALCCGSTSCHLPYPHLIQKWVNRWSMGVSEAQLLTAS